MTLNISLLPHQKEFFKSTVPTILVGGFGSGKSDAGAYKTIKNKLIYKDYKVAYYLPTYPLVRDIAFDKFTSILEKLGLKYKLNKSDKEINIDNYSSIIFRTMSEPETIVGYEVAYSLIDEADILPFDKMHIAYNKILGRNRSVENASIDMVSTPEGFKFLYEKANSGHFKVIRAKTTDNKFIPKNYIDQLKEQYPEQLLKAYLNGDFVNLTSGSVYFFDRTKHNSDITHNQYDKLIIGQDFNIGGCCSVVYVQRGTSIIAVDEFISNDTFEIVRNLKQKYPNNEIEIIPDASGTHGSTNASKSDIAILREAGYRINAPKKNPRVQDRVNTTNNLYEKNKLFINTNKCPNFTKAQEQQAYDKGIPEKFSGAGTIDDWNDAGTYPLHRLFGFNRTIVQNNKISIA